MGFIYSKELPIHHSGRIIHLQIGIELCFPLQKNNFLFLQQITAAHAALPICCSVCVLFFTFLLFTQRVNETLDEAKPIHLNTIVQTASSEKGASELPVTPDTCSPAWAHAMERFNWRESVSENRIRKLFYLVH